MHLHHVGASSGTWACIAVVSLVTLGVLRTPRRLGAARIIERRVVLVSGSDRWIVSGSLAFPVGDHERHL